MLKYYEPWIEKDKRRGTRRVRWWKRSGGAWVKDKGISCGRDNDYAKEVREKVRGRLKAESLGEVDLSRDAKACFEAFAKDREINNYAAGTIRSYRTSVVPFLNTVGTMGDLADAQKVKDFKTFMLTPGSNKTHSTKGNPVPLKANTVRRRLMDIRVWLGWSVAEGWLKENPWTRLVQPGQKKGFLPRHRAVPRFYTDEEIEHIETAIQTPFWKNDPEKAEAELRDSRQYLCMWRMCYDSGLREGEICKAKNEDLQRIEGGEGLLTVRSIKGGKETTRVVVLSHLTMDCLPEVPSGHLFPGWVLPDGSPDYVKLRWHWDKTRRKAKLVRDPGQPCATFYQGRHTFARRYLEAGGDLRDLKEALGHSSLRMIDEIYGHIRSSVVQARMRAAQRSAGQWRGKIEVGEAKPGQIGSRPVTDERATQKRNAV